MAVPSSRVLFAYAIPTIIVLLSYIWFKRKKRVPNFEWIEEPVSPLQQQQLTVDLGAVGGVEPSSSDSGEFVGSEDSRSSQAFDAEMVVEVMANSSGSCRTKVDSKDGDVTLPNGGAEVDSATLSSSPAESLSPRQKFDPMVVDLCHRLQRSPSLTKDHLPGTAEPVFNGVSDKDLSKVVGLVSSVESVEKPVESVPGESLDKPGESLTDTLSDESLAVGAVSGGEPESRSSSDNSEVVVLDDSRLSEISGAEVAVDIATNSSSCEDKVNGKEGDITLLNGSTEEECLALTSSPSENMTTPQKFDPMLTDVHHDLRRLPSLAKDDSDESTETVQPVLEGSFSESFIKAVELILESPSEKGSDKVDESGSASVIEVVDSVQDVVRGEGTDKVVQRLSKPVSHVETLEQSTLPTELANCDLVSSSVVEIQEFVPEGSVIELDSHGCDIEVDAVTRSSDADQRPSGPEALVESDPILAESQTDVVDAPVSVSSCVTTEADELPKSNCDALATGESKGAPLVAASPGLPGDDPELQKLSYQNSTSAYGSASHSPADGLESPTASNYSDLQSEGSSDSGKGGSDIHTPSADGSAGNFQFTPLQVYEFELPQELCGRLIGQRGRYVNLIKNKTNASISVKRHPFNPELKLCAVLGTEEDISAALMLIRKRFPLSKFPVVSMLQVNAPVMNGIPVPDTLQLHLPDGVTCDVILSSLVNAGHFFVQQPTHPTYSSLSRLDQFMLACYMNGMGAPKLPTPVEAGIICAASTMGGWYRAQIVYVYPDSDECEVKFVDYGGYSKESISSLRQIRSDFMTLPFQASECFLANVSPVDESQGWTLEASSCFEELAQGQILQAQIVAYSDEGIPYVHLYRIQGVMHTFINQELVNCGHAKWTEHQA